MAEKKPAAKEAKKTDKASGSIAEAGKKVKIDYVGSFDDGKVFDASERAGKPIEFVLGSGQIIPGLDRAITGMKVGEEKQVKLEPKDAYGETRKELEKIMTRDQLPKDQEPKEGMVLVFGMANGAQVPARISKVNGDMVTIDFNHPLAGKNLNFKVKVVGVE